MKAADLVGIGRAWQAQCNTEMKDYHVSGLVGQVKESCFSSGITESQWKVLNCMLTWTDLYFEKIIEAAVEIY